MVMSDELMSYFNLYRKSPGVRFQQGNGINKCKQVWSRGLCAERQHGLERGRFCSSRCPLPLPTPLRVVRCAATIPQAFQNEDENQITVAVGHAAGPGACILRYRPKRNSRHEVDKGEEE